MKRMIGLLLLLVALVLAVGCNIDKNDSAYINMDEFSGAGTIIFSDNYDHSVSSEGVSYAINEISKFTYDVNSKLVGYEIDYECGSSERAEKYLEFLRGIDEQIAANLVGQELGYSYSINDNVVTQTFAADKVAKQAEVFTKEYVIERYKSTSEETKEGERKHTTSIEFEKDEDDSVIVIGA